MIFSGFENKHFLKLDKKFEVGFSTWGSKLMHAGRRGQKHGFNTFVKCLQVVKLDDCTGAKGVEALEGSRF